MNKSTFDGCHDDVFEMPRGSVQYFFDDSLIFHTEHITRSWMRAKIKADPLIKPEYPWETRRALMFGSVLPRENGGFRMYYSNYYRNTTTEGLIAQSDDGIIWSKPELDIFYEDGRATNLFLNRRDDPSRADSISVAFDDEDDAYPYKLCLSEKRQLNDGSWHFCLVCYKSRDGIHFEKIEGVELVAGDRTNLVDRRVNGKFEIYTRGINMMAKHGSRCIYRSVSADFVHWSEPELVLAPDREDPTDMEMYGMSVFFRNGWYIGLLENWRSSIDEFSLSLAVSRDGVKWLRPSRREQFIVPEHSWNAKWLNAASSHPCIIGEQMAFYIGGGEVSHHYDAVHQHGAIGVASIPCDCFCALEAGAEDGVFVTVPIVWPGGELNINFDGRSSFDSHPAKTDGEAKIEILEYDGTPVAGFSQEAAAYYKGNTSRHRGGTNPEVIWENGNRMDVLRGKVIRLCFRMRYARLFTFMAK